MWALLAFLLSTGVDARSLSLDSPDQLEAWLEGRDVLVASCRREMEEEERISISVEKVILVEAGSCSQIDHPSGHMPI